ncbi:hypothetical protein B0H14DRAFT_3508470 [Mycena olivaceomarginata]|nr:hypothetical protein B0H14DRAFT_3508470 [Mycena olivaceomarginata]
MEKKRLSNDQPDYHSLLAALTQILHGLLLNAWSRECGFPSFKLFADSKPNPATLRYPAGDESSDSESDCEAEALSAANPSPAPAENPKDDDEWKCFSPISP